MSEAALKLLDYTSIEDYLEQEQESEARHEYADGQMFAMAGANDLHEAIATNVTLAIGQFLRGKGCRLFKGDMKLRLRFMKRDIFYYPDLMVVCSPQDTNALYKESPRLLIEVLSPDENRDFVEKYAAYTRIASLEEYVVIRPDPRRREAWIYRKADGWENEQHTTSGPLDLRSIGLKIEFDDIFHIEPLGP